MAFSSMLFSVLETYIWESENKDVEGTPSKIPTEKFFLVNSFCYINLFSYFSAETDFYIK
jgi:hypothetical protein